jgi:hypothetical protein
MLTRSPSAAGAHRNARGRALPGVLLLVAAAVPVHATPGVWKCAGTGASPVYQDRPCAPGRELGPMAEDHGTLSIVPLEIAPEAPAPAPAPRAERPPPRPRAGRAPRAPHGDAAQRRHVREGMSEGEVLARLGGPALTSGKGGRKARWTYLPAPEDPQTVTQIRFEDGRVAGVERVVVRR